MKRTAGTGRRTSPWAIASLVCSLMVFCPLVTMVAPVLGVKALADIRSRPGRKGNALAAAGIIIGLLTTAGWIVLAAWWHREVRQPILAGPQPELEAGFRGDLPAFRDGFTGPGAETTDEQAAAFINELTRRYGRFHDMQQAPPPDDPAEPGVVSSTISYVLEFQHGLVEAEAEFVVFPDQGLGIVGKWRSIVVFDDELGDLRYPP